MHQALVMIVLDQLLVQYESEIKFCQDYLNISIDKWKQWKNGETRLSADEMQQIKNLFSDYEWMLIQKVIRQTILFPEKRNYVVFEYKRLKTIIAKKWIQSGAGFVEMITHQESYDIENTAISNQRLVKLKVSIQYGEWGFDDILEFYLPARIQKQIEDSRVGLLEWVHENLTDTYVNKEGNETDN